MQIVKQQWMIEGSVLVPTPIQQIYRLHSCVWVEIFSLSESSDANHVWRTHVHAWPIRCDETCFVWSLLYQALLVISFYHWHYNSHNRQSVSIEGRQLLETGLNLLLWSQLTALCVTIKLQREAAVESEFDTRVVNWDQAASWSYGTVSFHMKLAQGSVGRSGWSQVKVGSRWVCCKCLRLHGK